jgi:hypothetical protein
MPEPSKRNASIRGRRAIPSRLGTTMPQAARMPSMRQTTYVDLPEFGLHFVPFEDPRFPDLLNQIMRDPRPFPAPDLDDLGHSAVLLNESGKAIIVLGIMWRYEDEGGHFWTRRLINLHSSTQMEILCGRLRAEDDLHTSILPGSKRLVTERGLFGTNSDVLPTTPGRISGGGYGASGGGAESGEPAGLNGAFTGHCDP